MKTVLTILVFIAAIVLIAAVLLQEGKSAGMSGTVAGGAESLFGKSKARGIQAILQRTTIISGGIFMFIIFVFGVIYK